MISTQTYPKIQLPTGVREILQAGPRQNPAFADGFVTEGRMRPVDQTQLARLRGLAHQMQALDGHLDDSNPLEGAVKFDQQAITNQGLQGAGLTGVAAEFTPSASLFELQGDGGVLTYALLQEQSTGPVEATFVKLVPGERAQVDVLTQGIVTEGSWAIYNHRVEGWD